jgi:hypothetical protein
MCASLRQALIAKLSKVGKDKEAWGKADDQLAGFLNEDQMMTIADTVQKLKATKEEKKTFIRFAHPGDTQMSAAASASARKRRPEQRNVVNTVKRDFGHQNGNQTGKDDRGGKDSSLVSWRCVLCMP